MEAICVAPDLLRKTLGEFLNVCKGRNSMIDVSRFRSELLAYYGVYQNKYIYDYVCSEYIRHLFRGDAELSLGDLETRVAHYLMSVEKLKTAFVAITIKAREEFNEILGIKEKSA